METINKADLKREFIGYYGEGPGDIRAFFAPGRVNLIGEHTDYNNGYVMPFGLQYGTYLLTRTTSDPVIKFKSRNFSVNAQVCLKKEILKVGHAWINYPLGVIREFVQKGFEVRGVEMFFAGDIPHEAGLSSSASVEIVTAFAINELFKCGLDNLDLVKLGQRAENDFVGMKCGIMDQFAVTMGKKDHAVFLDCGTLDYELVPFTLNDYSIIICNTNKKRGLADSKYNERRLECEKAIEYLSPSKKIKFLSDLNPEEFGTLQHLIPEKVIARRAAHVISENQRVLQAMKALKKGDLASLGRLMVESHNSLRDDYEVSCFELDAMVELAGKVDGVLGSRMTGAGFGGCAISLVHRDAVEEFVDIVGKGYQQKTGLKADFYRAEPGDGVRELESL